MNRAIEQAGSIFTGWIHSCLFCPTGADDDSFHHDKSAGQNGAEREMRVCHTQPHLVPPMKLVVYDDLPSPGPPPRVTSLPSWMMDGKDLRASRASNRTSTISFRKRTSTISFKRRSTAPIRISAPSDFRRVPLFATTTPGNPPALELSFNTPGHHLPELPQFEDFQIEENRRQTLTRPAKVLKPADTGRLSQARSHHRASSSIQLSRKPVGSGSRRSSLATVEHHLERALPAPSPLIPHFSTRPSTVTGMTASLYSPLPTTTISTTRPDSTGIPGPAFPSDLPPSAIPEPQTPLQAHLQARTPLPPTDEDRPSSSSVQRPPTTSSSSDGPANRTPPRTGRVTQWLFNTPTSTSTSTSTNSRTSLPVFPTTWKPSFTTDKTPFRLRSRTLSGSTLASSASSPSISTTANMTGAAAARPNKITPSPSSSTTAFPRQTARPSEDQPHYQPYPTIYESDDLRRSYYENQSHSQSPIGVAF